MAQDLRELLFLLYLRNNPQLKHQVFIYTYQGVGGMAINPFQYVCADLEPNVRKSLILQNLPAGEMLQAFIVPQDENHPDAAYEIENTVLYGNKAGVLIHIELNKEKIERSDKYKQFTMLADSMLKQFN